MAEQFDWSKVLERMRDDGESPKPGAAPLQAEVAQPVAPATEEMVTSKPLYVLPPAASSELVLSPPPMAIEAEAPITAEAPVEVAAAPAVEPMQEELHSDPLAWDEDDFVVPAAPAAVDHHEENEAKPALPPLYWDDDTEVTATHEVEQEHCSAPTLDMPPSEESASVQAPPVFVAPSWEEADPEPMTALAEPPVMTEVPLPEPEIMAVATWPPVLEDLDEMTVPLAMEAIEGSEPVSETLPQEPVDERTNALMPAHVIALAEAPLPPVMDAIESSEPLAEDLLLVPVDEEAEALVSAQVDDLAEAALPPVIEAVASPEPVAEAMPLVPVEEAPAAVAPPLLEEVAIAAPANEPPPLPAWASSSHESNQEPPTAFQEVKPRDEIRLLPTAFDNLLDPIVDLPQAAEPEVAAMHVEEVPHAEVEALTPQPFDMAEFDAMKVSQAPVIPQQEEVEAKPEKKPRAAKKSPEAPKPVEDVPELKLVKRSSSLSFGLSDKRLGSALMDMKAITREQLEDALAQQVDSGEPLGKILVRRGVVSITKVLQVVAIQRGLDAWDLEADPPKSDATALVAGDTCAALSVLPVAVKGDLLVLAMADPDDSAAIERVREESRMRVQPVLADPERLAALVQRNYHLDARSSSVMDSLVDQALKTANESGHAQFNERAQVTEEETRPVVGFVNQIIHDAIRMRASDIHLEPRFDHAEIRYRLDGQLMTMREVPQALVPMVVTRLKIMAELDIVEYRVPQDGRMSLQFGTNSIDLRVSCLPSLHGQRIVMRVLDKSVGLRHLDELGFDPENLSILRSLVEKPYGLFLATGPTGSGKTTTLYAAIQEIRREGMNVMTCEDPVEYDLEGVNQSQVNERVGLTFAEQLRAILRQDPDIVLVGEVRDHETAETAVRAAMTGHMVMSTLHCNDAPSAIARLLDLGIDPFLLSTSLIGTMSQRLVRRLCPVCRREEPPTADETEMMEKHFGVQGVDRIWQATGCDKCHKTGYKGRVAVSEIMPVVEEIAALIAARAPLEQIKSAASMYGYLPMQSDAMVRVARGETSLDEARRTVFFDTIQRRDTPRQIAV